MSDHKADYLVGIGASAGGLEALQELVSALPEKLPGIAIVVTQHLSPSYKSMLAKLLQRHTKNLEVLEIADGEIVKDNRIYITPPDSDVIIKNKRFFLQKPGYLPRPKPSVDIFFQSIAQDYADHAIGVILSGTGSDGAMGCRAIHMAGGKVIVQDPSTARYRGMPQSTLDMLPEALVLTPHQIGENLIKIIGGENHPMLLPQIEKKHDSKRLAWQKFFSILSEKTGVDFSRYKLSSIYRRLDRRLIQLGINDIENYISYLEKNPGEVDVIYNQILIGVTEFFRDPKAFADLEAILKEVIAHKTPGESFRAWVPGCATGEEAYSLAILIAKQKPRDLNVQIFATDISETALRKARAGIYSKVQLQNVPDDIIEEYFILQGKEYEIAKPIRQMVLFSKHDITQNPPFLRLDLISCRNLLIYFSPSLQQQILPMFHYALNPDGILFLGKSESVGEFTNLFHTISTESHIYRKIQVVPARKAPYYFLSRSPKQSLTSLPPSPYTMGITEIIKETLYNTFDFPYVIINSSGEILHIYGDVRDYLTLSAGPVHNNLYKFCEADLQVEVRSTVGQAIRNKTAILGKPLRRKIKDKEQYIRIFVKPLLYSEPENQLYMVVFENLGIETDKEVTNKNTNNQEIIAELEREIQATREQMQTFIEELETANEELQSLNEELQSANEELQSSNEELETSNEELQSANEELQIAYGELRSLNEQLLRKEEQLESMNLQLEILIQNAQEGFILLDQNLVVLKFNNMAKLLLEKISGQEIIVGKNFLQYVGEDRLVLFSRQFKEALEGKSLQNEVYFYSHIPTHIRYRITPELKEHFLVVSFLDITLEREQELELREKNELFTAIFEESAVPIAVLDHKGRFGRINKSFLKMVGYNSEELENNEILILLPPEERKNAKIFIKNLEKSGQFVRVNWNFVHKDGHLRQIEGAFSPIYSSRGRYYLIFVAQDITEQVHFKELLMQTQQTARVGGWEYDLTTGEILWTDEVYEIHEVPKTYQTSLESNLRFYEAKSREILEKAISRAIEYGEPYDLELEFYTATGKHRWVRTTGQPIRSYNKTVKLYGTIQDITQTKVREAEVKKLSLVATYIHNGVIITDANLIIQWVNEPFLQIFSHPNGEILGISLLNFLRKQKIENQLIDTIKVKISEKNSFKVDFSLTKPDISFLYLQIDFTPILLDDRKILYWIGVITDLTSLKKNELSLLQSLEERTILLKEVHHRVKNNLAIISSLLQLQQMSLENPAAKLSLEESRLRIQSMALIHEKIYSSENLAEIRADLYLQELALMVVNNFNPENKKIDLDFEMEPISFNPQPMVPLGLLANEVLTNSLKHAFPNKAEGKIKILFRQNQGFKNYTLVIRDNGVGFSEEVSKTLNANNNKKGIGLMLIEGLAQQLDGKYVYQNCKDGGVMFRLDFQLAN